MINVINTSTCNQTHAKISTSTHTHTHTSCPIDSLSIYNSWYNTQLRWSGDTHTRKHIHTQTGSFWQVRGCTNTHIHKSRWQLPGVYSSQPCLYFSITPSFLRLDFSSLSSLSQHISPIWGRCHTSLVNDLARLCQSQVRNITVKRRNVRDWIKKWASCETHICTSCGYYC